MKRLLFSFFLAIACYGQTGTAVSHIAAHIDACNQVASNATTSTTLTLTPNGGGQIVYVCAIDVQNCAGASAVSAASPTTITTTGLTGSPVYLIGSGVAAGACAQNFSVSFTNGGLAATGPGNVTFVGPAFATNQTVRMNIYWRSALPQ